MTWITVRRAVQLLVGLFCYGFAIGMMIQAHLGVSPWDVLGQGAARSSGIPFGVVTVLIGALVLLLWIPLRQKPGIGTVLNVLMIGPSAEVCIALVSVPEQLWAKVLLAAATGIYLGARLGPGPRDGLMTGMHRRFGWPVWAARTGIEVGVLSAGWALGGTVGLGTVAFALLVGPMVSRTMPFFDIRALGPLPDVSRPRSVGQDGIA